MGFDEDLSATLATIYSGFSQSEQFDPMLRRIAHFTGGDRAAILLTDPATVSFRGYCSRNLNPEIFENYNSGWNKRDPIRRFGQQVPVNGTLIRQQAVRNDEYENTDYFQTINQAGDLKDSVFGAFGAVNAELKSGISVYRSFSSDYFSNDNAKRLQLLLPHLQNALLISRQLNAANSNTLRPSDERPSVHLTVRPDMSFHLDEVHAGRPGDTSTPPTLDLLNFRQGKIVARNQDLQGKLEMIVDRAIQTGVGGAMVYPLGEGEHCIIRVAALSEQQMDHILHRIDPTALMIITPPQPKTISPDIRGALCDFYDLTPKELTLIEKLLAHGNLKDAAENAKITHETARWHIKNILSKTGCASQVELILKVKSF